MFTTLQRKILFVTGVALLIGATAFAVWQSGQVEWQTYQQQYFAQTARPADIRVRQIVPKMTGQPELCTTCHIGLAEISASHPVEVFGCTTCHGGNGLSLEAAQAHAGLVGGKNPADMSVLAQTCGEGCHAGHAQPDLNHATRVQRSVQGTYAGAIAAVRFAFGAQADPAPLFGVYGVSDPAPAAPHHLPELAPFPHNPDHPVDRQFAQNCLDSGCHLSAEARAAPYFYRATGCAACHVIYEDDGLYRGDDPTIPRNEPGHMSRHQFTTAIPFYQCNHCHNRGNYSLRQMEFVLRDDLPPTGPPLSAQMPPEGRRLIEYYQPIGQFTLCEWELDCIECHTAQEAMGDGHIYPDQREMQYTQCRTCHGTAEQLPDVVTVSAEHQSALRAARLNPNYSLEIGDRVLVTERGELLGNVKVENDQVTLTSKVSGQSYPVNPVLGSGCQQNVEQQESRYCHECHAYQR
ncbi:MAG: hypothetical protein D6768_15025 [Chloroflexi bacterium]|nr:MAG: hypothetical protein D6768_15025 [Chloroflexota bacterium]